MSVGLKALADTPSQSAEAYLTSAVPSIMAWHCRHRRVIVIGLASFEFDFLEAGAKLPMLISEGGHSSPCAPFLFWAPAPPAFSTALPFEKMNLPNSARHRIWHARHDIEI